jgi:CheY-like chemotaxis protein
MLQHSSVNGGGKVARKILFADDDSLMRKLYQHYLENAGYKWVEASDGQEAVEVATRENPSVAVLDIAMPEKDGFSVMLDLQRSALTRDIPVILVTSDTRYYSHQEMLKKAGARLFLTKPFGAKQLLDAIQRCLSE